MVFQPFGYRFDVSSSLPLVEAKAALRSGLSNWFEARNAPRGWIAGPLLCLWLSAFNQQGPMLVGWISTDNFGTRVSGRAGSDLNGILMFSLLFALMAFLLYGMIVQGSTSPGQLLWFAGIFLICGPLVFWFAHRDRREAEPLVDFVSERLGANRARSKRPAPAGPVCLVSMQLIVCGDQRDGAAATPAAIEKAVEAMRYDPDGFIILERDDEQYTQVATGQGGFIVERRESSAAYHFRARRADGTGDRFSADETIEVLCDYLNSGPATPGVSWERLSR